MCWCDALSQADAASKCIKVECCSPPQPTSLYLPHVCICRCVAPATRAKHSLVCQPTVRNWSANQDVSSIICLVVVPDRLDFWEKLLLCRQCPQWQKITSNMIFVTLCITGSFAGTMCYSPQIWWWLPTGSRIARDGAQPWGEEQGKC